MHTAASMSFLKLRSVWNCSDIDFNNSLLFDEIVFYDKLAIAASWMEKKTTRNVFMFYNKIKCPAHYNVCKYPVGYHFVLQKFQNNEISSDPSLVHIFVGHEDRICDIFSI